MKEDKHRYDSSETEHAFIKKKHSLITAEEDQAETTGAAGDDALYAQEEYRYELENRINNLLWTVSGDYTLNIPVDVDTYLESRYIALYDAVKQGAFSRFYSHDAFGMYLMKKLYLGADEVPLMTLAQMCVDQAVIEKVSEERPGILTLRKHAFEDILENEFTEMAEPGNQIGRIRIALLQDGIDGQFHAEQRIHRWADRLIRLRKAADTDTIIRELDDCYNQLYDPDFPSEHGTLEQVMAVAETDLKEFNWQDFLNEEALESLQDSVGSNRSDLTQNSSDDEEQNRRRTHGKTLQIDEEAAQKVYSYIEMHYGISYLDELQQQRINKRICRGMHSACQLYYTDGILHNPVQKNASYVLAARAQRVNEQFYRMNRRIAGRSITQLGDILRRTLQMKNEEERLAGNYGSIVPGRIWKIGRTRDREPAVFERIEKKNTSDFVVSILIDASGSQQCRQEMVALQGYILAAALSRAQIPHQLFGFCTFWDYTVMRRFREYDDGPEADRSLLEFVSSANNRDGLAIRAATDSLLQRPEENKVLIILSDGKPNDQILKRNDVRNKVPYFGESAIRDTASEVRRTRGQGISVMGVFVGDEEDLTAERRIFGKDFAYIRNISTFAHIVGQYLKKLIDEQE